MGSVFSIWGITPTNIQSECHSPSHDTTVSLSLQLVESLERDITDYRECVEGLGTSLDKEKYRQQLPTLRENIQKKIKTVENDIQAKKLAIIFFSCPFST